ncbi:hypothetical protein B0J12DRAFT_316431 [Macrophomina phaseolina]|uniref:Uncharacterized protein n=1 Tax=Macrophomina phaseolina TaxID=35725 RepID=A0ABQ8FW14_9PEZI|nr:hypothetical protein B0J12DRAFT_316431 [Macrophomina phaseolina]
MEQAGGLKSPANCLRNRRAAAAALTTARACAHACTVVLSQANVSRARQQRACARRTLRRHRVHAAVGVPTPRHALDGCRNRLEKEGNATSAGRLNLRRLLAGLDAIELPFSGSWIGRILLASVRGLRPGWAGGRRGAFPLFSLSNQPGRSASSGSECRNAALLCLAGTALGRSRALSLFLARNSWCSPTTGPFSLRDGKRIARRGQQWFPRELEA